MKRWTVTDLPADTSLSSKDRFYAEIYPSGQLKHFAFYRDGHCNDGPALYLEEAKEEGILRTENGSGGSPDLEIYKNGAVDRYDIWTDSEPKKRPFDDWVSDCIRQISRKKK